MIDLYSIRNWLLRKLAGSDTIVINANVWARLDILSHHSYIENMTMLQTPPAGTLASQFPTPPPPAAP